MMISATEQGPSGAHGTLSGRTFRVGGRFSPVRQPRCASWPARRFGLPPRLSDLHEERWCLPELLRIKSELLLADGRPDAAVNAEEQFLQALDWGAPSRRSIMGIARGNEPRAFLARPTSDHRSAPTPRRVYMKFTEGFETADLLAARDLLQQLA